VTFLGVLGGVVDVAAGCTSAALLAAGGTIAARNRRPGQVRVRGRVVPQPRLVATWTLLTGGWGVLASAKRFGLPVSGLLIIALMPVCLALLALLLARTQPDRPAPRPSPQPEPPRSTRPRPSPRPSREPSPGPTEPSPSAQRSPSPSTEPEPSPSTQPAPPPATQRHAAPGWPSSLSGPSATLLSRCRGLLPAGRGTRWTKLIDRWPALSARVARRSAGPPVVSGRPSPAAKSSDRPDGKS
jgi:hypothetical protein